MKKIVNIILALMLGLGWMVGTVASADLVFAASGGSEIQQNDPICKDGSIGDDLKSAAGCSETRKVNSIATNVINVILYIVGIVAVIFIVIAAIQISASAGNPSAVAKAKQTLIYAIAGLIVAILAYAIVNFVLKQVLGAT